MEGRVRAGVSGGALALRTPDPVGCQQPHYSGGGLRVDGLLGQGSHRAEAPLSWGLTRGPHISSASLPRHPAPFPSSWAPLPPGEISWRAQATPRVRGRAGLGGPECLPAPDSKCFARS